MIRLQKSFFVSVFAVACLTAATASADPTVWSGLTLSFSKPFGADFTQPEFQDHITDNVALTRPNGGGGVFNILVEETYFGGSPADTEWATSFNNPTETISATNWAALDFDDWENAYGGAGTLAGFIVGADAVLHLITDDIYLDLRFTNWGIGHSSSQGAFTYLRAEGIPEPSTVLLATVGLFALAFRRRALNC